MSARHRTIAGAPRRPAGDAAGLLQEMIVETLASAEAIDSDIVREELSAAQGALRMLIAGKHLSDRSVVLVADPLRLEITVRTGASALTLEEKLGKVAGAATATEWALHIPAVDPIREWLSNAIGSLEHVTDAEPPVATAATQKAALDLSGIDADALRSAAGGDG